MAPNCHTPNGTEQTGHALGRVRESLHQLGRLPDPIPDDEAKAVNPIRGLAKANARLREVERKAERLQHHLAMVQSTLEDTDTHPDPTETPTVEIRGVEPELLDEVARREVENTIHDVLRENHGIHAERIHVRADTNGGDD